jgi:hypothetical protein
MSKFFLLLFLVVSMRGQGASIDWCVRFGRDSLDEWRNGIYKALCRDYLKLGTEMATGRRAAHTKTYIDSPD